MNNSEFDNKYSNWFVSLVGTIIRAFERMFIVFFDGLRSATVHGSPSLVKFFAAISPITTPIPMAAMTAVHLMKYLEWEAWQAVLMAASLEIIGFPLWVFFAEAIFVDGWTGTTRQILLAVAVAVYEVIIIAINAILSYQNGDVWTAVGIFFFACLLPALSGIAFSHSNKENKVKLEQEEQEMRDAQVRAEQNELKLKMKMVNKGMNPLQQSYAADAPAVNEKKEKHASDYRDRAIEFIEKHYENHKARPTPKQLTERFGLEHSKNKGYMSSLIKEVFDGHGWQ